MSRPTGFANLPLHRGNAPAWLFGRMRRSAEGGPPRHGRRQPRSSRPARRCRSTRGRSSTQAACRRRWIARRCRTATSSIITRSSSRLALAVVRELRQRRARGDLLRRARSDAEPCRRRAQRASIGVRRARDRAARPRDGRGAPLRAHRGAPPAVAAWRAPRLSFDEVPTLAMPAPHALMLQDEASARARCARWRWSRR